MTIASALFSSNRDNWETPSAFFTELDDEFHFQLDAAATQSNAKCLRYLSPEDDALTCRWTPGPVWLNPPFQRGRPVNPWVRKAYEESQLGATTVVCLLPSRTDTRWFHEFIKPHAEVRFISGRLRFVGAKNSAPFPSLVAIFRPNI